MMLFFSSRTRHTRCGRDWSSDVCSSDLLPADRLRLDIFQQSGHPEGLAMIIKGFLAVAQVAPGDAEIVQRGEFLGPVASLALQLQGILQIVPRSLRLA